VTPTFDPESFKVTRLRRRLGGVDGPAIDLGFAVYGVCRAGADDRGHEVLHPRVFQSEPDAYEWRRRIAANCDAIDLSNWIVPIEEVARGASICRPHLLNPALYCSTIY
jgi:hypothetical protein